MSHPFGWALVVCPNFGTRGFVQLPLVVAFVLP